ncbi:uncharacterized protein LOC126370913 [Pectinophora gossypiella]|uniref:uncharacterized protein LOC126370913 n=1 Tax=Pectinophora gossypiella TaxID=13191 RepID=UPI00214E4C6F|nr:uncharacterized protein LOC126370913 [Pectinophora gossypiella]
MQFEYDPDRLIEEVKKRPGIWNYEDVNYRTAVTRHELWNEVVRQLLQPNVKVNKSEMRELVLQLQKKWKSIKDSFIKYIQNPNRTKRPYIYCKQLQFLLKNESTAQETEGAVGGASSESDDGAKPRKQAWRSTKKRLQLVKDEEQTSEDDNDTDYQEPSVSYSNDEGDSLPLKIPRNSKTVDEFAFANVDSKSVDLEDADKMFLLSLLPHLKSIPEELRLNAKMELLQVLRNANFNCNGRLPADDRIGI